MLSLLMHHFNHEPSVVAVAVACLVSPKIHNVLQALAGLA